MRLVLAFFVVWFGLALWPDPPAKPPAPAIEEKVWMSQTCDHSRWYLEESDDQTATLACYKEAPTNPDED